MQTMTLKVVLSGGLAIVNPAASTSDDCKMHARAPLCRGPSLSQMTTRRVSPSPCEVNAVRDPPFDELCSGA